MKTKTYSTGEMSWAVDRRRWRWAAWGVTAASTVALGIILAVVF